MLISILSSAAIIIISIIYIIIVYKPDFPQTAALIAGGLGIIDVVVQGFKFWKML